MKSMTVAASLGGMILSTVAAYASPATTFDETQVREIVRDRVFKDRRTLGLVVGTIDQSGQMIVADGEACTDGQPVTGDTVFEIGSLTKPFTMALLYEMASRGEIDPDAPIARDLARLGIDPGVAVGAITPRQLAEHTSGLPRMPSNVKDESTYSVADLGAFLSRFELTRAPGLQREYSNLGYGLLGLVLASRAGKPYPELLRERIFQPLGMKTASVGFPERPVPAACGHNERLEPEDETRLSPVFEGAGGIRASMYDLLRFLDASMRTAGGPIRPQWGRPQQVRGSSLVLHDGSTDGFASYIAYDPQRLRGVVVLANSRFLMNDIGLHLLQPLYPLVPRRAIVQLSRPELDRWVGEYAADGQERLLISRYGSRLFLLRPQQLPRELFAEGKTRFFLDEARPVTFSAEPGGPTLKLFQRDGTFVTARRVTTAATAGLVDLAPASLARFTGRYAIDKDVALEIWMKDGKVMAQISGQVALEILPVGKRRFRYMDVDAEIEFSEGEIPSEAIIHQGGDRIAARRQ